MTTDTQPSTDREAATAAAAMRALPEYEREWLIARGEMDGKVYDLRPVFRGGLEARLQEGVEW